MGNHRGYHSSWKPTINLQNIASFMGREGRRNNSSQNVRDMNSYDPLMCAYIAFTWHVVKAMSCDESYVTAWHE